MEKKIYMAPTTRVADFAAAPIMAASPSGPAMSGSSQDFDEDNRARGGQWLDEE